MLLALSLIAALHADPTDSLPGKWQIKGDVAGNPLDEVCTIKQTGTILTGSCTNPNGGPYDLTGESRDGKVTFQHGGDYQGTALTIIYTGTLASKELKGTVDVKPFDATGTFTAAPAPATAAAPAKP
ncbi:hypothetical protein J421_5179 (plasmid) [Gemmatirosa kalamazoonensis]|uniref:Uncharacterized protein n=1 Tax=Gemmatirosa kalamazoonensis TaxID=861299 RepID=W0RNZ4_9BACT|nr:hypothetical protein [Gemmatirosa kalamazoonensis]AHG92714.1 hypothetical protein J421_5179 [Gemmatirosa kalamazoonensis]